jgi:hypothetical protein
MASARLIMLLAFCRSVVLRLTLTMIALRTTPHLLGWTIMVVLLDHRRDKLVLPMVGYTSSITR